MKPQPFNLELWLHLGKPDCVWTRGNSRVTQLAWHKDANQQEYVLSGIVSKTNSLSLWTKDGRHFQAVDRKDFFTNLDLMMRL